MPAPASWMAGDAVRRKLGQDLHDGAQQRLTAIQIMATMARERTGDRELAEAIESIGSARGAGRRRPA